MTDLEPFVLVAENSVQLSDNIQASSGDIASNKSIHIAENGIINGNLFSDRIQISGNTSINGNTATNKLIKAESAEIFGEITNNIQKNIVELSTVQSFQTGTLSHIITEDTTLNPGNYNEIEVKENAALTLTPGTYNLNKLTLKDNSRLLYSDTTIINVKTDLKIQNNTLIASNNPSSVSTTELQINYTGKSPASIGDNNFITAKILSPSSRAQIGNKTTFRGQIFALDVHVGEEGVLSRKFSFEKPTDPDKVIESEGVLYVVNEVIILMEDNTPFNSMFELAEEVGGELTGFLPLVGMSKIEINSNSIEELFQKVEQIKDLNNPNVFDVIPNFIF